MLDQHCQPYLGQTCRPSLSDQHCWPLVGPTLAIVGPMLAIMLDKHLEPSWDQLWSSLDQLCWPSLDQQRPNMNTVPHNICLACKHHRIFGHPNSILGMMGWWQQTNNLLLYHSNTNDSTIFLVFVAKMLGEGCLKHCNISYFARTQYEHCSSQQILACKHHSIFGHPNSILGMMGWWQQTNNPLLYHNNPLLYHNTTNDSTIFLVFVAKMLGEGCLKHCNVSYFSRTQSNWAGLAHYGAMPEAEVVECATTTKRCILCAIHQCTTTIKHMPTAVCVHTYILG